jgi:hypothetical protein
MFQGRIVVQTTKFALFLLLLFSAQAWAIDVSRYLSGSWYNPSQDGHGLSVEVLPDGRTVIYWYAYHPDGTPTFIIAIGDNSGNKVIADAYYNSGMKFGEFNPADRTQIPWGTITLTFHSCSSATLQYNSTIDHNGVPYGSGSIALTRLASIDGLQCSPTAPAGLYQGNFYSYVLDEFIPGVAAIAPDGKFAAVSFDAMAAVGNWSVNGITLTGSGTAVSADPNFTFSSNLSISGQISPEYRMVGSYNVSGGDYGSFDFYAIPELYRRGISLSGIAGNYNARNLVSGATGSATILQSGSVSGSDSLGCQYSGQITIPDPQFNLFQLSVTVTSCGPSNGTYQGYGNRIDYYNLNDGRGLQLMATNGQYAGVFDLYK